MSPRLKSLELRWVSKHDKGIPYPNITFQKIPYGGLYINPTKEYFINDCLIEAKNGLIIVSDKLHEYHDSIIAHEWRHHWQLFNGWEYDGIGWDEDTTYDEYNTSIDNYVRKSKSEFDAFRFQWMYSKIYEELYEIFHDIFPKTNRVYFQINNKI